MSFLNLLDDVLVAAIVLVCAGYAMRSLGPRGLRRGFARGGAVWLRRFPKSRAAQTLARWFDSPSTASGGGCGGGCADCEPRSSSEVRVPIGRVGRR